MKQEALAARLGLPVLRGEEEVNGHWNAMTWPSDPTNAAARNVSLWPRRSSGPRVWPAISIVRAGVLFGRRPR
jgi:hypothetical protein